MANPRAHKIGDILVKARVIDELQLRSALSQHENWGGRLANVVADMGLATEEKIVDTLARALGAQRIRLGNLPKDAAALGKLDVQFCEQHGVFPFQLKDGGKVLFVAMADPSDLETVDEIGRRARSRVSVFVAGEREIQSAISRHYRGVDPSFATQRQPQAAHAGDLDESAEEMKIVDMSGRTVMKRLSDIDPNLAKQEQAQRTAPPVDMSGAGAGASTADILDDILGGGAAGQLSQEDLARLETVRVNQEKSAKIIRAVMELLAEKGLLSPAQLQKLR